MAYAIDGVRDHADAFGQVQRPPVRGDFPAVVQVEQQGAQWLVSLRERPLHPRGQLLGTHMVAVTEHRLAQGGKVRGRPVVVVV